MTGRWRINIKSDPKTGAPLSYFTCSECGMTFAATNLPLDQLGGSPKWCLNCGSDNRERERDYYTRAEIIMQNMRELIDNYDQREEDECWWENEYGSDLTDMIDCHVVFKGDPPCLLDERKIEWEPKTTKDRIAKQDACAECKAIWLMEKYE